MVGEYREQVAKVNGLKELEKFSVGKNGRISGDLAGAIGCKK